MSFLCPKCRKKHWHGAGNEPETPLRFYGHRHAHCINRDNFPNGYYLVGMGDPAADLIVAMHEGVPDGE